LGKKKKRERNGGSVLSRRWDSRCRSRKCADERRECELERKTRLVADARKKRGRRIRELLSINSPVFERSPREKKKDTDQQGASRRVGKRTCKAKDLRTESTFQTVLQLRDHYREINAIPRLAIKEEKRDDLPHRDEKNGGGIPSPKKARKNKKKKKRKRKKTSKKGRENASIMRVSKITDLRKIQRGRGKPKIFLAPQDA